MQMILFAIADLVQGNLQMDSTPKLNMQQNVIHPAMFLANATLTSSGFTYYMHSPNIQYYTWIYRTVKLSG